MDASMTNGISRRAALKGVGVGAVAVWAAPTVSSLGSTAMAGSFAPCTSGGTCARGGYALCGDSGPFHICFCMETQAGDNFCSESKECPVETECTTDADCEAGWKCADTCGDCDGVLVCNPPCGANLSSTSTVGRRSGQ